MWTFTQELLQQRWVGQAEITWCVCVYSNGGHCAQRLAANAVVLCWQILLHEDGSLKGVATGDVGIAKDGSPKVGALDGAGLCVVNGLVNSCSSRLLPCALPGCL